MLVTRQPTPKWRCHISDISDSQGLQGSGIQFQEEPRSQLEYWVAVSGRLQCYAGKWLEYLGCYQVFNKRSDFTFSCWTSLLFHLDHRRGDKETEWEGTQAPFSPRCMFSSVAQLCPTLCDPMNRSTPGLPVHQQLAEFTQTHVHQVGDAIQLSHTLSSPSPPASNPSQHQSLFQ